MIVYRSDGAGGVVQTTLTPMEASYAMEVESLQRLINAGDKATEELRDIQRKCQHQVFEVSHGEPYDLKYCVLCGKYEVSRETRLK